MENNIDKLFNEKLNGDHPPFEESAWNKMESILNEDNPAKKGKKRWLLLLLLSLFMIGLGTIVGVNFNTNDEPQGASSKTGVIVDNSSSQNVNDQEIKEINVDSKSQNIATTNEMYTVNNTSPAKDIEANQTKNELISTNIIYQKTQSQSIKSSNTNSTINNNISPNNNATERGNVNAKNVYALKLDKTESDLESQDNNSNLTTTENEMIDRVNEVNHQTDITSNFNLILGAENRVVNALDNIDMLSFYIATQSNPTLHSTITPAHRIMNRNRIGLAMNMRYNNGLGVSFAPFILNRIGNGIEVSYGIGYDMQNISDNNSFLQVEDISYSFGSEINSRFFKISSIHSAILPLQIKKAFGLISVNVGATLQYALGVKGQELDDAPENGTVIKEYWVESNLVKDLGIHYQVGLSCSIMNNVELEGGVVSRDRITTSSNLTNGKRRLYPYFQLNYFIR